MGNWSYKSITLSLSHDDANTSGGEVSRELDPYLNDWGGYGFELVSVVPVVNDKNRSILLYTFKRPSDWVAE